MPETLQVLESNPALTPEALRAVFAFAAEVLHDQALVPFALEKV